MPDEKDYLDEVENASYCSDYLHVMELDQILENQNLLCAYINM